MMTYCAWCSDRIEDNEPQVDTDELGAIHQVHVDRGEIADPYEDDGDPDGVYDRMVDAAMGV